MLAKYLEAIGFDASIAPWQGQKKLPLYLRSGREFLLLEINGIACLIVCMNITNFNMAVYRKRLCKLNELFDGPIALCFNALTPYQRQALIKENIPFVVPESQMYFPFLCVVLQERASMWLYPFEQLMTLT